MVVSSYSRVNLASEDLILVHNCSNSNGPIPSETHSDTLLLFMENFDAICESVNIDWNKGGRSSQDLKEYSSSASFKTICLLQLLTLTSIVGTS